MPLIRTARNTFTSALIVLLTAAFPVTVFAQDAAPETPAQSQAASVPASGSSNQAAAPATEPEHAAANPGPTSPTGSDSNTYTQNKDGIWTNGTYNWDPNTRQTSPVAPQDYSYNPKTGLWDTTAFVYSPESGKYIPNVVSSATNPNATALSSAGGAGTTGLASGSGAVIDGTGPNSNNNINLGTDNNGTFNLFFNGAISNKISSNASTGNSVVQGNTSAGGALTGDASALANVLNLLQSSWFGQSGDIASFISNIDGNVYGDLLIDPNALPYALGSNNSNIDVNVANNGAINNDINLAAKTGNATVNSNTLAGNATTGNAKAMANVINMINSAIHSGKSFLGMVNINGSLDGDILLPKGVLDALIASTGPNSNNTIGGNSNNNLSVDSNASRTISNNIKTDTSTGNAKVDNNTSAGSATTGQSGTNVNSMNVVGQNVKAKNGLLVFVNVLGKWVGLVVGPANATINNTGPNSNNTIGGNSNNSVSVNANENSLINNNINLSAQSGDAAVTNNTQAGSAKSGNADATVNLLNVIGSNIDVTDWFGVLFINVFGSWFGNFGADSANGGFSQSPAPAASGGGAAGSSAAPAAATNQVFGFVPQAAGGQGGGTAEQPATTDQSNQNQAVFGSTTPPANGTTGASGASITSAQFNWWVIAGIIAMVAAITVLVREYVLAVRAERLAH
jgi:hypothetical protein